MYYQLIKNIIFYNIIVLHYFTLTPTFLSYFVFLFLYILYIVLLLYNNHPFKNNICQKNIQKLKISLDLFWIWKSKPKCSDCQTIVSFTRDERQWRKVEFVHYFRGAFTRLLYAAAVHMMRMEARTSMFHREHSHVWKASPRLLCFSLGHMNADYAYGNRWNKTRAWSRDMLFRHERAR